MRDVILLILIIFTAIYAAFGIWEIGLRLEAKRLQSHPTYEVVDVR